MLFIVALSLAFIAYVLISSGLRGQTVAEYVKGVMQ